VSITNKHHQYFILCRFQGKNRGEEMQFIFYPPSPMFKALA